VERQTEIRRRTGAMPARVSRQLRVVRPPDPAAGRRQRVHVLGLAEPRSVVGHAARRTVDHGTLRGVRQARARPRAVARVRVRRAQHGRAGGHAFRRRLPGTRQETRAAGRRGPRRDVPRGGRLEDATVPGRAVEAREPHLVGREPPAGIRPSGGRAASHPAEGVQRNGRRVRRDADPRGRHDADGPVPAARARRQRARSGQ